jgi:hypothetical protein
MVPGSVFWRSFFWPCSRCAASTWPNWPPVLAARPRWTRTTSVCNASSAHLRWNPDLGAAAGAAGPGRRWPVAADAGSHPLEVRRGSDINFLVLGIAYRGIALPVFWSVLGKAGNSNTAERKALMERFLAVFGVGGSPCCWPTANSWARRGSAGCKRNGFPSTSASNATRSSPITGTG